ncbi:Dynein light chain [Parasponia andersonii]|uniref:Dynein light chain n=1 Tax=Parasponia andersonii TaxID=3476 RepID=A0A2P5CJ19_PARAD|nr:Dynein light chain [Parasponia andersonii]
MADRTTQRRTLAGPNSKVSSMDDQTIKNPDPICPTKPSSMTKSHNNNINLSRSLDAAPTVRASQKKPASQNELLLSLIDSAHFQAKSKAMSASAIVDSSKYSLSNANTGQPRRTVKDVDDTDNDKDSCREKSKSRKKVEKKQFCQVMMRREANEEGQNKYGAQQIHSVSLPLAETGAGAGAGRRRRSFCGSHLELPDVFASNGVKVVSVDMPPFMQIHAVEFARKAHDSLEKFTSKTLACALKKEFDGVYGPAWHCIVGTSFGSFVTHSVGGFLYFSLDQKLYILMFKTTVQRAD